MNPLFFSVKHDEHSTPPLWILQPEAVLTYVTMCLILSGLELFLNFIILMATPPIIALTMALLISAVVIGGTTALYWKTLRQENPYPLWQVIVLMTAALVGNSL